jgi:hypothetical protein
VVEESVGVETREQIHAALGDMWTVLVIYSPRSPGTVMGPHRPEQ